MRDRRKFCRPKVTKYPEVGDVKIVLNCGQSVFIKAKDFKKIKKSFKNFSFVGEANYNPGNILVYNYNSNEQMKINPSDYDEHKFKIVEIIGAKEEGLEGDIICHNEILDVDAIFSYDDWITLSDSWDTTGLYGIQTFDIEPDEVSNKCIITSNGTSFAIKYEDFTKVDSNFRIVELIPVDMGLPSGTLWAWSDIDITKPGGFCDTPFTYEKSFFSWGNIDGHNPTSNSSFSPYNWGGVNQAEPWYEGQPYGSTKGNTLTGNIAVGEDFDAARANLGAPWRMPTNGEYGELFANIIYINADGTEVDTTKANKRVTVNGIVGLYIQSKINGARLFFSCSGYGSGSSWDSRGSNGNYWSSTFNSSRNARRLNFDSGGVSPQYYNYRCLGFAVRAVQNKN